MADEQAPLPLVPASGNLSATSNVAGRLFISFQELYHMISVAMTMLLIWGQFFLIKRLAKEHVRRLALTNHFLSFIFLLLFCLAFSNTVKGSALDPLSHFLSVTANHRWQQDPRSLNTFYIIIYIQSPAAARPLIP